MSHSPEPPDRYHKIKVNGTLVEIEGPDVDGRSILRAARLDPADDHILVQIIRPGSFARGLDEKFGIGGLNDREFRAFRFDRTLNFTVDGVGYVWGGFAISVTDLYDITGTDHDKVFFLERQYEPDQVLAPGVMLDLEQRGIEHIHTGNRLVIVRYGEESFKLERRLYTTEELLELFKVPSGYVLELIEGSGDFRELKPNERIKVREGMDFISHAPCGQSS